MNLAEGENISNRRALESAHPDAILELADVLEYDTEPR